jgi:hypothetical protein
MSEEVWCPICKNHFEGELPGCGGESVVCPHCGAEGFFTYDANGDPDTEWYESEFTMKHYLMVDMKPITELQRCT